MKRNLILLILLTSLLSCEKKVNIISIVKSVDAFDQIEVNDAFEVYLSEGQNYSIEIVGDENKIDDVELKVEDRTLKIKNNRKSKWTSPKNNKIILHVNSLPLKSIIAAEGCNIQTQGAITSEEFGIIMEGKANQGNLELNCDTFYYWNNFPTGGKLRLYGKTNVLKIWNVAIMSVDAKDLTSNYAIVENGSTGDCEVTVLDKLEYSITEKGNIQLYGSPAEIIDNGTTSSGRLIKH